jgi:uncharacterized NAD-dependent epimerase/dehydratase family protein
MIGVYEETASTVREARVACIAVNCKGLSSDEARRTIDEIETSTGLATGDVFAGDGPRLWSAVAAMLEPISAAKK